MAHDVFISYSTEDKAIADAACATIEARKIRCWIAPRDVLPGTDYGEALAMALDQSRVLVLVLSASSNRSAHVKREVEIAVAKGVIVVPFRIEAVSLSPSLRYFLSTIHWLDALTPPLEKYLDALAETVGRLIPDRRQEEATPVEDLSHRVAPASPPRPREEPEPGHVEEHALPVMADDPAITTLPGPPPTPVDSSEGDGQDAEGPRPGSLVGSPDASDRGADVSGAMPPRIVELPAPTDPIGPAREPSGEGASGRPASVEASSHPDEPAEPVESTTPGREVETSATDEAGPSRPARRRRRVVAAVAVAAVILFAIYAQFLSPWVGDGRALLNPALAHYNRGDRVRFSHDEKDRATAISEFTAALARDPNFVDALVARAWVYLGQDEYDKAIDDCARAIAIDPTNADAYEYRALAFHKKGDSDSEIADYTAALAAAPNARKKAIDHMFRAFAHADRREFDAAIADFTDAIRLDPDFGRREHVYAFRAHVYAIKGDLDKAINDLTEDIRNHPTHSHELWVRGALSLEKGDAEAARADFAKAARNQAAGGFSHFDSKAADDFLKGDYGAVIATLDEGIGGGREGFEAYGIRALVHFLKGDYDAAIADGDAALRLNPTSALAYVTRRLAIRDKGADPGRMNAKQGGE